MPDTDHRWTPEDDLFILDHFGKMSYQDMGEQMGGLTRHQVRNRHLRLKAKIRELVRSLHSVEQATPVSLTAAAAEPSAVLMGEDITDQDTPNESRVVHFVTNTTRDIPALLEKCKVDMKFWRVKESKVRKWDSAAKIGTRQTKDGHRVKDIGVTELWYVSASLVPREDLPHLLVIEDQIEAMRKHAPAYDDLPPVLVPDGQFMWEYCPFDHHFGKYADPAECRRSYTLDEATDRWWWALEEQLGMIGSYPIRQVLFPLGNDLLHFDNIMATTTRGTPQDASGRWRTLFKHVREIMVKTIERLTQVAPVTVKVVWGNHDTHSTFCIGDSLECWFHNNRRVTIDNAPTQRKYHAFGCVLLGFTHLDKEKVHSLPSLMAVQAADLWKPDQVREWHGGHLHASKTIIPLQTIDSVKVRVLPSLCGPDVWHDSMGYQSLPQCESFIWHAEQGLKSHLTSTVLVEEGTRRAA